MVAEIDREAGRGVRLGVVLFRLADFGLGNSVAWFPLLLLRFWLPPSRGFLTRAQLRILLVLFHAVSFAALLAIIHFEHHAVPSFLRQRGGGLLR
jgi:hypothetical protein